MLCAQACSRAGGVGLDGSVIDPLAGGSVTVLAFVTTQCPISNQYAPLLQALAHADGMAAVHFWLVYPSRLDTPQRIHAHRREFGLDLPALRDPEHRLSALARVTVTPSAAVFTAARALAYSGRIDDRFVAFGVARRRPTGRDLEQALQRVRAGLPVQPAMTAAVGCAIAE